MRMGRIEAPYNGVGGGVPLGLRGEVRYSSLYLDGTVFPWRITTIIYFSSRRFGFPRLWRRRKRRAWKRRGHEVFVLLLPGE